MLAIDSGMVAASEERLEAERIAERAARERRTLEGRRRQWLPGRRRELEAARERESAALEVVAEARRREAEVRHGGRSFVPEHEQQAQRDASFARMAERKTERILQRDRAIGREL